MHEILFACADLTEARSSEVRMHAALVIASLVLYENVSRHSHFVPSLTPRVDRSFAYLSFRAALFPGQTR